MGLLMGVPTVITLIITTLAATSLCTIGILLAMRWRHNAIKQRQVAQFQKDESPILEFLYAEPQNPLPFPNVAVTPVLRDHLVNLGKNIEGLEKLRLGALYDYLGFLIADAKLLHGGSAGQRCAAIARLRNLEIPLPDNAWEHLLREQDTTYRWAAMEYLIAMKGTKSLFWLGGFVGHNKQIDDGIVLHLLSCLAKKSQESILKILEFTDDPRLVEMGLRTLAFYPMAEALPVIAANLSKTCSDETFIAGIKALGNIPCPKTLDILQSSLQHPHWVVRLEIAKAPEHYDEPEAQAMLQELVLDASYHVRLRAIETALKLGPMAASLLGEISRDPDHPSHQVLNLQYELRRVA